ncbi:MAG: HK97 family phage prohead protease [Gammaproteobacteria bacterium]
MTSRELERSALFQLVRAEADDAPGDGLTMEGHAAMFGVITRVDSWEGVFDEQVRPGAFRKSIRERTPVLLFEHGRHPLIGSIPLGVITEAREDDDGLFVRARMTDNWLIQPIRDAISDGAVDGMSFRFEVVREEWRDADGKLLKSEDEIMQLLYRPDERGPLQRTLIELKVPELGPVVFPNYRTTDVAVRARSIAAGVADDENFVRQVRASLARSAGKIPADLGDPELRCEVARALLFDAPPPDGHPSDSATPERSEDAPPDGHPSEDADAPPPDGHPSSLSDRRMTAELARLNGLIDIAERKLSHA